MKTPEQRLEKLVEILILNDRKDFIIVYEKAWIKKERPRLIVHIENKTTGERYKLSACEVYMRPNKWIGRFLDSRRGDQHDHVKTHRALKA